MKVLHFINSLEIGGAQRLVVDLLPLMRQEGITTDVLLLDNKNEFNDEPYLYVPKKRFSVRYYKRLLDIMNNYDIVHVHLFPTLYIAALLSLFGKFKVVYTEHNTSNRRRKLKWLRGVERLVYRRYSRVISISKETQEALLDWLSLREPGERFVCIENGVNLSKMRVTQSLSESNEQIFRDKYILMVSRFSAQKDQATLIRSIPYIADKDIKFVFAGEGTTKANCMLLAKELGVQNRTVFLGNRHDIPLLVFNSVIGVQSSHWEGFGLTAIEFMAVGKPIIASDVPGLSGVVGGAGLLFCPGNYKDLADKISLLLEDSAKYSVISERCLARAKEYTIEKMANRYIKLYNGVCCEKIVKRKILFCDNSLRDLLNFRGDVINSYAADGFEVVLVAPETCEFRSDYPHVRYVPVELSRSGMNPLKELSYMRTLWGIYRRERPDYIFHYTIKPNIYGTLAARLCRIPSTAMIAGLGYVFNNSGLGNAIARALYRFAMRYSEHVLVLNAYNRDVVLEKGIASLRQLILLPGGEGINLDRFRS